MPRRALGVAAAVETASLAVLLVNLATAHLPWVASALGPVHGTCYLVVVALAWQVPAPTRVRALSLVPAIGGLLVLRRLSTAVPGDPHGGSAPVPRARRP